MNIPQILLNKPVTGTKINFAHPLARGLVLCQLLNELSGKRSFDLSPYKNHGELHGFNDPSRKDRSSLGLSFDGASDYVDCGDPVDGSLDFGANTDFSVFTWIKTSDSGSQRIITKYYESSNP